MRALPAVAPGFSTRQATLMHERKLLARLLRLLIHRTAVHKLSDAYVREDCGEKVCGKAETAG
jgi:hypothetical protein